MALFNLAELKDLLDITGSAEDTDLQLAVDSANEYVDRITRTTWGTTATQTDEPHDRAPVIFLDKIGVNSITTVKSGYGADFDTLTSDQYRFNVYGRLMLSFDPNDPISHYDFDEIRVTYEYGYATVPDDLKLAAMQLASMQYRDANNSGLSVIREKIGSREVEYGDNGSQASPFDVIDSYKV